MSSNDHTPNIPRRLMAWLAFIGIIAVSWQTRRSTYGKINQAGMLNLRASNHGV